VTLCHYTANDVKLVCDVYLYVITCSADVLTTRSDRPRAQCTIRLRSRAVKATTRYTTTTTTTSTVVIGIYFYFFFFRFRKKWPRSYVTRARLLPRQEPPCHTTLLRISLGPYTAINVASALHKVTYVIAETQKRYRTDFGCDFRRLVVGRNAPVHITVSVTNAVYGRVDISREFVVRKISSSTFYDVRSKS